MEQEISLYEVYNILKNLSLKKAQIYQRYANLLANDFDLEIIIFKKINLAKKEITLFIKKYDYDANRHYWQELTITKKDNSYNYNSNDQDLHINIFNSTSHLNQLFSKLDSIKDFLKFKPIKITDTTNSCNITLSIENIKIYHKNGHIITIPFDSIKFSKVENTQELDDLLKSIIITKESLPNWLQLKYTEENSLSIDNIIKKLKQKCEQFKLS